jgi:hypothetical protein
MADSIELEVATPERAMVSEQVSDVQVPGQDGYLGILPRHAPLLSLLGAGALSYTVGGVRHFLAAWWKCLADRCVCWRIWPSAPKISTSRKPAPISTAPKKRCMPHPPAMLPPPRWNPSPWRKLE